MTANEVLLFIMQISIRMFELLMILVRVVCKPTEAFNAVLEDNKAWLEQQMREVETQRMIDDLYRGEA